MKITPERLAEEMRRALRGQLPRTNSFWLQKAEEILANLKQTMCCHCGKPTMPGSDHYCKDCGEKHARYEHELEGKR